MVRNPLYLGNFVAALGAFLMTGSIVATLAFITGMLFVYHYIIIYEDTKLERLFGAAFIQFKDRVPRLLPSLQAFPALVASKRSDSVTYNNLGREAIRALQALLAIALLLTATYIAHLYLV